MGKKNPIFSRKIVKYMVTKLNKDQKSVTYFNTTLGQGGQFYPIKICRPNHLPEDIRNMAKVEDFQQSIEEYRILIDMLMLILGLMSIDADFPK